MFRLLEKIFIKDADISEPETREKYGVLCGSLGIVFNLLLFAVKLVAGIVSGSIAVMSDAFNNLSDVGSCAVTIFGFKLSSRRADNVHPFGHGRFEYISGLVVSMLIILMGAELLKSSVARIAEPAPPQVGAAVIIILVFSVAVKFYMYIYNSRTGKLIASSAVRASGGDSISDCAATLATLVSLLVYKFFDINIDGWCGAAVALFIIYSGVMSARDTISPLLGKAPEKEFTDEIVRIVSESAEIVGIHDLIVHDYGPGRRMISLHAEVPADSDILLMHDAVDAAEHRLRREMGCQAVIHMDPVSTSDPKTLEVKKQVEKLITVIDDRLTLHDFRMVDGPSHTNVIFEVSVPYNLRLSEHDIKEKIALLVNTIDKNYFAVVDIDRADI